MTPETLFQLLKEFEAGSITRLEYAEGETRLALEKAAAPVAAVAVTAPAAAPAPAAAAAPAEAEDARTVDAPLVGTFYTAPDPSSPAFVKPGDTVKKGQTMCIVEAMKMINEVPAPFDCVIEKCLVADGELVGFGQAMFAVREL